MLPIKKQLTSNPKTKPSTDGLVFGCNFTDHMFVAEYEEGKGWYEASITPYTPFSLDPATIVLHYAQAVFEGLKCYKTIDNRLLLFRPEDNFKRLNISSERLCIPDIDVNFAMESLLELLRTEKDWVPSDPGTSLYIRPLIFATNICLGVKVSRKYKFIIILSPVGSYYDSGIAPVKIFIDDKYVRAVPGGVGYTKASANYAISLKGQQRAKEMGYAQVLWLDGIEHKYIEEVGSMNVFFMIDNVLVTPSLTGSILAGITRDSVIKLAKSWGISVEERRISVDEIFSAHQSGKLQEAFGSGTAAVISPIGQLRFKDKEITLSNSETGEFSKKFYDELTGIQYGEKPDPFGWVKEVNF